MLRIGQVEATATQDGKYTDGSVAGGIAATRLRAAAFNAMQEELAHIVESAGLALDINDMTQVLKAIQKLTLSRANPFADIKSDGAAAISTALTNLGLIEALKNKQPLSDTLTKLSTLGPQTDADQVLFFSGKNVPAVSALTLAGRQFISKENVPDMLQYLTLGDGSGRLLGVQVFGTSGMYYKSPGVTKIIVEAVGGGGASGNLSATASNNCGISAAGSPGAYGKAFYYQDIPESVPVTIGAGGVGGAGPGGSGGDGGQTSFGSLLVFPGGKGSQQRQQVPPFSGGSAAEASPPTGAGLLFHSVSRSPSCAAFGLGDDMAVGLESTVSTMIGVYGKGGTGKYGPANSAASRGNDGSQGYIIVWEYQ
ncbi:TPA: hypothetical protein QHP31_004243 [Escherichia coli]|nr:hypothetical protein [Escherichia coli]